MITASAGVLWAMLGAVAEPAEPVVAWEAPPGCGTAQELRDRVTRQLGTLEADIEIVGRVHREAELHVLELELVVDGERQRRSFSAVDCRTLLDAAAIVSSAALGPGGGPGVIPEAVSVPEPGAPEPAGGPGSVPEPVGAAGPRLERADAGSRAAAASTEVATAPAPASADRSRPGADGLELAPKAPRTRRPGRWLVSTRIGVGWDGTLAPPVGSLGVGRAWSRWRLQALVDLLGGRAHGLIGALDLRVVTVSPRACAIVRPHARIELLPCAGVAAGPAVGRGRDVLNARTDVVPWLAAELDFGVLVVPRPWLAAGIELSNYVMLGRPHFALSDRETVYRAGGAGSRAFVTIELRFSATDRAAAGH